MPMTLSERLEIQSAIEEERRIMDNDRRAAGDAPLVIMTPGELVEHNRRGLETLRYVLRLKRELALANVAEIDRRLAELNTTTLKAGD